MSWLFPWFVAGAIRASDNMRQMSNEIDRLRAEVARQNKPVQDTATQELLDELREERRQREERENNERIARELRALRQKQAKEAQENKKKNPSKSCQVREEWKSTVRVWRFVYDNEGEWLDSWAIDKEYIDINLIRVVVRDPERGQLWVEVNQANKSAAQEVARGLVDRYLEVVRGKR